MPSTISLLGVVMFKLLWLATTLSLCIPCSQACTVFAATGAAFVKNGGTLVSKVRDERPGTSTVKTVNPPKGYSYTGLFTGLKEHLNMGINEKGLFVARTTAGSVDKDVKSRIEPFNGPDGLKGPEYLVRNCASVDEALQHKEVFNKEPINYILADAKKIAFVEVLPDGKFVVVEKDKGVLSHTNHYITKDSFEFNHVSGISSQVRLNRIQQLLSETKKPFQLKDFISFTEDAHDGVNNSIFRPNGKNFRTLATMSVYIPENGEPEMYLKWLENERNPDTWLEKKEVIQLGKARN